VLRLPCLIPHEDKPVAQRLAIAVGHYLNIKVLIMRCVLEGLKVVADTECLSWIRIFPSRISDPESERFWITDSGSVTFWYASGSADPYS
jgi:hypothetical protein